MKKYIVELKMNTSTDGYYNVVIEGETHINRTVISSNIQFFTTSGGYDYNHPWKAALQNAQAIANGLNELEKIKSEQQLRYAEHPSFPESVFPVKQ